jgi:hypothetical protein
MHRTGPSRNICTSYVTHTENSCATVGSYFPLANSADDLSHFSVPKRIGCPLPLAPEGTANNLATHLIGAPVGGMAVVF